MGKNLICLVTILLVLGPTASAPASLVAHWKLDEQSGTTAKDSSTKAHHATVGGTPNWVTGMVDGALDLDGTTNYLDVNAEIVRGTCTVTLWLKPRTLPYSTGYRAIVHNDQWNSGSLHGHLRATTSLFNFDINGGGAVSSTTVAQSDEWYHLTGTFDTERAESNLYVNGVLEATSSGLSTALYVGPLNWGAWTDNQRFFDGVMDDVRVYSRALTASQVQDLANGIPPTFFKAEKPDPEDGAPAVVNPLLMWTKGETAVCHDVYFGTTPELTEADLKASCQSLEIYYHGAGLAAGTTYFWRIDEIAADGTVYTGDVWSFATAPAAAYAPVPRDGDKWIDPNSDLSWRPGHGAIRHDVYFSTDQAAVASRDTGALKSSGQATVTFEPGELAAQTTYYWAVDEQTLSNATYPGDVWQFTTTGGGGGVKGEYFNGMTPEGVPALTRIDPSIDFDWGDPGGPDASIPVDQFSARWTADLEIAVADTYTFIGRSDDGIRIWLDDELIVDAWVDRGPADSFSQPVALEPGIYSLCVEYYENTGGALAQVGWQTPTVARAVIPAGPLQPPVRARAVYPRDNDANIPQDVVLMWSAGEKAVRHAVYFGEDETAVAEATPASTGIYRGTQALDETTFDPGGLEWDKTYYWRIDEVNDAEAESPWTGSVWSFTTADFLVVDNFETYDDVEGTDTRIYETWVDGWITGNGSTVGNWEAPFAEQTIVHSGRQSMPFDYNNVVAPFYSEAYREFAPVQNWTVNGVTDLVLFVRGYPAVEPVAVTETAGKMTVTGSGADIWGTSDEFTFVYKTLRGNGTIVARVDSNGVGSNRWAKGGVMIRDSLDGGSTFANMVITGGDGNGAAFQWRGVANTDAAWDGAGPTTPVAPPYWVKVERLGDNLTGYLSADGNSWIPQGTTQTIAMSAPVYIGLCVTSHAATEQRTYEFSNIATTGGISGDWQGAIITAPVVNSQQPLYVIVEDSTGKQATVVNPDPGAVNATAWTEWKVPLSDFADVSLTKVKRLYLGVGDKSAVGSGRIYIDDIRVTRP